MSIYGYASVRENDLDDIEFQLEYLTDAVDSFSSYISGISTSNAGKVNKAGDTMTGNLVMNANKITSSNVPSTSYDLVNKLYTDTGDSTVQTYVDTVASGKLDKSGGTISGNLSVSGNLTISGALSSGAGSNSVDCFVSASGQASIVTNTTGILKITSGYNAITYIPYTGTLNNYQKMNIFNNTTQIITLGHNSSSENGTLLCLFYTLYPKRSVDVVFDHINLRWVLTQVPSDFLFNFNFVKWSNDSILNVFLNPNHTQHVKLNFFNTNTTVNGVSSIQYVTNLANGPNWSWSRIVGSFSGVNSTISNNLTDTESNKLTGFIYGATEADMTVTNLTVGNYYMLQIYHQVFDDMTNRVLRIDHRDTLGGNQIHSKDYNIHYYSYGTMGSNSPGVIATYIFRPDITTSEKFTFSFGNAHIYALVILNLGSVL